MSYYLYNSYCYETAQQVAASIQSSFTLPFGVIQSVIPSGSSLTISYLDGSKKLGTISYPLATCEKLGFDNNFSGLSAKDSLFLAETMVGVLITAWAIKIVRRAL